METPGPPLLLLSQGFVLWESMTGTLRTAASKVVRLGGDAENGGGGGGGVRQQAERPCASLDRKERLVEIREKCFFVRVCMCVVTGAEKGAAAIDRPFPQID